MNPLELFPSYYWLIFAGLFGSLWGSFANVVICRWPQGLSIAFPGSHCPVCGTLIAPFDNIPVLSYLLLRARCRSCGVSISARYPLVELSIGVLSAACFKDTVLLAGALELVPLLNFGINFVFCWALVVIAFIDLDTQLIPTVLTGAVTVLGLAAHLTLPGGLPTEAALGVVVGFGMVWLGGKMFYLYRGEVGIGLGDAHLLAMVGAVLGWKGAVFAMVAAAILSLSVVGLMALVSKSWREGPIPRWRRHIPLGPFLSIGALIFFAYGSEIIDFYLRVCGF